MSERLLYQPILRSLRDAKILDPKSVVALELPINGRRVDLAAVDSYGTTYAYEFKSRDTGRAIRQAGYNALSFDRSFAVLGVMPNETNKQLAVDLGVGVVVVKDETATHVVPSGTTPIDPTVKRRTVAKLRQRGGTLLDVLL